MSVTEPDPKEGSSETSPPPTAPDWAISLQRTIEELPGKLKAAVTDDDKRQIAETVHGLFESSGAFERPTEQTKDKEEEKDPTTPATKEEPPPKKTSGMARFASWFAGEE